MQRITIRLKPNAKDSKVVSQNINHYVVEVKSAPEKGKANIELVKFMSKHLGKKVRIVSGLKSRDKVLEVLD